MKTTYKFVAPLLGAALLVALIVATSFWSLRQTGAAIDARQHTYEKVIRADILLSSLKDAETGQRGYLLTGDETLLAPYFTVRDGMHDLVAGLRAITLDIPARQRLDATAQLLDAEFADMAAQIDLRRRRGLSAAAMAAGKSEDKRLMDSIRAEMGTYLRMQDDMLAQQDAALQSNMRQLSLVIIVASLLSLLLTGAFAWLVYREKQHASRKELHLDTRHLLDIQEQLNRDLVQANTILRVSEAKTVVTLNSIGDAVIVTDVEGRVTLLNPLAEKLTGWTQAEADGRLVDDIFRIVNQETRRPATVPVKETLAKGTLQGMANHTVLIARDLSETSIADSCAPIRGPDGEVAGAVLVFRDVTQEYATQQKLRDNAALIQTILNTVVDGVITLRASGGIIETVNPAAEKMFGYTAAELIGQNFSLLIPELDKDQRGGSLEYYSASEEARAAGRSREVMGLGKDGTTFPLEIAVSEMWLGGQRYFTGILRDFTVRKRVEAERNEAMAQAEKASRAKTDFLSSMSHELRTPLNAILGFAQLMEAMSPPPTPAQKRNIDQILKAGWYLLELINEILDLALIESGKVTLSPEPVALADVMLECRAMIEAQAQKRGISLTFPQFEQLYFVSADRTRIKQVMINLLFNAIKYNRPQGAIIVEATVATPGTIRISVRDTGEGLTPEQMAQLFEPFNRLGKETSTEEGTGIGLVVTKRLVEMMSGIIGVSSIVGTGSVFWVELKLTAAPVLATAEAQLAAQVQPQVPHDAPPRTLLYVEDNPANLELIEQLVARRPDLRLLSAADGNLGIEFARVYLPEVILMDINLPGINGIEAMKILRTDPLTAHIPIIALSANALPRDIEKGLEAGFFDYLTKPIKVNQFMHALDLALDYSRDVTARKAKEQQA